MGLPYTEMSEQGNLALLIGMIAGVLMREGLMAELEVQDGNYTGRIFVTRPSGRYALTVEPVED